LFTSFESRHDFCVIFCCLQVLSHDMTFVLFSVVNKF